MPIPELKLIEQDKLHHTIAKYIKDNEIINKPIISISLFITLRLDQMNLIPYESLLN